MLKVGDTVQDMRPQEYNEHGEELPDVPTGIIWFVTADEPRDDGKVEVVLERYDDGQMITSTMTVNGLA
ncbi:MAG: hypothetical protein ACR2GC_01030 [Methyloceanibacter sp.]|uniref:hypothetical protein n=1 Tax=Methyloceanibacter sp. TaxID=1965321 RepID=UPI003D9B1E02